MVGRRTVARVVGLAVAMGLAAALVGCGESDTGAAPSTPAPPVRRLGTYLPTWGTVRLNEVPAAYNLVFLAFAVGDGGGGGRVRFDPGPATQPASLAADIADAHRGGRVVVLSIGGAASGGVHVTTPAQVDEFVASVQAIVDRYDVDGIDWDLENTRLWNPSSVTDASRALLAHYGDDFVISVAPGPGNVAWKRWARQMGDDLDLFGMQFYEYPARPAERIDGIAAAIDEMVDVYGVDPSKLMIGAMTRGAACATCASPAAVYRDAFTRVAARYPDVAGAYVWSAQLDHDAGWPFATTMAPLLRR